MNDKSEYPSWNPSTPGPDRPSKTTADAPDALARRLEISLESAILLADPGIAVPTLAARIYDSEPTLFAELQRSWMIERITWMLYRKQRKLATSNQLTLPGFEKLPQRLTLRTGKRAALRFATLVQLREFRSVLWKTRDRRIEPLDRLIALVKQYADTTPGITVEDVMKNEMARVEKQ